MLLLGALVGAYHLGARKRERLETQDVIDSDATRTAFWRGSCSRWGWRAFSCGVI